MRFNLLTLFPEMFPGMLEHSLAGKALMRGDWSYNAVNIRDFATDTHKTVDDTPYGGGAGMVMRADVIERALLSIQSPSPTPLTRGPSLSLQGEGNEASAYSAVSAVGEGFSRLIYLSPRGRPLTQNFVKEFSKESSLTLLCGRYEGVDQRVLEAHDFEEISVGDYVLSGGEPAALILMDSVIRLLPGVMGNTDTPDNESFGANLDGMLEYPHYTRPASWTASNGQTYEVPDILKEGHHAKIEAWRKEQSKKITRERRPDLS